MLSGRQLVLLTGFALLAQGAIHNLFVGNLFSPASIYALEFNDKTYDFKIVKNNTADSPHAWITFDHAKKNIYGASLNVPRIANYRVLNTTTLSLTRTIPASGACHNTTSAFVTAMPNEPYLAFSAAWPGPNGCGMSFSVDADGTLANVLDSWPYTNTSGVHGLALSPSNHSGKQLLYAADLNADTLWTHAINLTTGHATEVSRYKLPYEGMHPRHLAAHPSGKYLYAVMEADNSLTQFTLNPTTGAVETDTLRYMLIPIDADTSLFWSAEVMLSPSGRYLWATARVLDTHAVDDWNGGDGNSSLTGYMTAFLLDDEGQVARRMFRVGTTSPVTDKTKGIAKRFASAVSPAFWSDEFVAVTDYPEGYVEVWKMEGRREGRDGMVEYTGARAVARVDVADGGCCANVIWYS